MEPSSKFVCDIRNKPILKHFILQEIISVAGTVFFIKLNMDSLIRQFGNTELEPVYRTIFPVFATLSGLFSPLLIMTFFTGIFYLVSLFKGYSINFKTVFKVSCIMNYIMLLNIFVAILDSLIDSSILKTITRFNIVNLIYLIAFCEILVNTLRIDNKFDLNKERISFMVLMSVLWIAFVSLSCFLA